MKKKIELIPNWNKRNLGCYFCGETRSVKYLMTIDKFPYKVFCCNKCACKEN